MTLDTITLANFKNIAEATLDFSPKVNCLLGDNGMGKSNLLDAIYFLSFTKSYSRMTDAMLIRRGEEFGMVKGIYTRGDDREEIVTGLRPAVRKTFRRGGKEYKRLSMHIGLFPAVMVAPADLGIVQGDSVERRRFMDSIISQSDPVYLDALLRYGQCLEQRNRLLRDGSDDPALYESLEMMMDVAAGTLRHGRHRFVARLKGLFADYYTRLAGEDSENVSIELSESGSGEEPLARSLEHNRQRDRLLKHTSTGPHRDDLLFTIDDMPLKRAGSQGQSKTFTVALRLAQYRFLREISPVRPLLLLDDIFDKLDAGRVERIVRMVAGDEFGQIFITDTNRKHLDEIVDAAGGDFRMWEVRDGSFTLTASHEAH